MDATAHTGKVVVIAGASAGIGRAVAMELASQGAKIALFARGAAGVKAAQADCERLGSPQVLAEQVDITDAEAVEAFTQRVESEVGPIDTWINVAMVSVFGKAIDVTPEEWRRVMDTNFHGFVFGTQAALRRMRPRDRGTIVQIGSALAFRGIPLQGPYCASQHAIAGFHDSLRAELFSEGSNVRVSMVQLPAVNTPQFGWVRTRLPNHPQPVPPIFQPEVVAKGIAWAAEHAPRDMNIGASSMGTRLGQVLIPSLLDRYLGRTGVDDQQTDESIDAETWEGNLLAPVDDDIDHGARGRFSDAKDRSPAMWLRMHRGPVLGAAALTGAALLTGVRRLR